MLRSLYMSLVTMTPILSTCCGPSTEPSEPKCGTEDVVAEAELVVGPSGPPCNPCSADADLYVGATLSTECGSIEWQLPTTCLVGPVRATRSSDGEVFALETRNCGSAFTDWSVTPDRSLTVREPSISLLFAAEAAPPGDYVFEVGFPASLAIEPAVFSVTVTPP